MTSDDLMVHVVDALESMGGSGSPRDVAKYIWDTHEAELRASGDMLYTWQYDTRWAAQKLRDDGVIKPVHRRRDLPWELA